MRALAAAENEVLAGLDVGERESLHRLLAQASNGSVVDCVQAAVDAGPSCS